MYKEVNATEYISVFIPIMYKSPKTKTPFSAERPKREKTGITSFSLNIFSPINTAKRQRSIFVKEFMPNTWQKYKS